MNIGEANAINRLLEGYFGKPRDVGSTREAAEYLATRAHDVLSAGFTAADTAVNHPRGALTFTAEGTVLLWAEEDLTYQAAMLMISDAAKAIVEQATGKPLPDGV